jgi:hypothetical protein
MTRRSLSNILSNEEQSLQDVWVWYEFQRVLIGEEKSRVFDLLASGRSSLASRYFGKTRQELDDDFTKQITELRNLTSLGMLASTEAALRIDFIVRVRNRKKDILSRRFRGVRKHRQIEKIRLEEDILEAWKECCVVSGIGNTIGEFKGVLKLRHWLAHGRYWRPKLGRAEEYSAVDVFDICNEMLHALSVMV